MTSDPILLFGLLLAGHMICDMPLQGSRMGRAKRGGDHDWPWQQALATHAALHGFAAAAITGAWWIGVLEFVTHAGIDYARGRHRLGSVSDQALHVVCKVAWVVALA